MFPSRAELLGRIYDHTLKTGEPLSFFSEDDCAPDQQLTDRLQSDIDYLSENGYLKDDFDVIGSAHLTLTEKGERFVEEERTPKPKPEKQSAVFNFNAPVTGNAIIGTQETVTQNVGCSSALAELQAAIVNQPINVQPELNEMLNILRDIQRTQKPIEKSRLARFYEFAKKSTDLLLPLGKFFVEYVFGR